MSESDPKADLHRYLKAARDASVSKLDGLSEYDIRRPMTPTGTNLLGLVKHAASVVRELIDGAAGLHDGNDNMPPADRGWWEQYRGRLEGVALEVCQR
jgi:Protein of unknown function (DUF664)